MKEIKYFAAFIVPLLTAIGIYAGGWYCWMAVIFAFVIVPILEQQLSKEVVKYDDEVKKIKSSKPYYDWLLYINLPIIAALLTFFAFQFNSRGFEAYALIGICFSMGICLASNGINVAHELGHRDSKFQQFLSKVILTFSLYTHFYIEHNRGHHKYIATERDPASAKKNELLYSFWVRSAVKGYSHAWSLEAQRLRKEKKSTWHWTNEMIWYHVAYGTYLALVYVLFGLNIMLLFMLIALISILMLETINYVEHYGLRRQKLPNGRYETVKSIHSWNSNHYLGRIMLYELTLHSDHHFQSNKKYQILEHHDISPQLPYGYPSSMLLAMVPPLWFRIMNKKIEEFQSV